MKSKSSFLSLIVFIGVNLLFHSTNAFAPSSVLIRSSSSSSSPSSSYTTSKTTSSTSINLILDPSNLVESASAASTITSSTTAVSSNIFTTAANNILLSTVSADIDSISNDEFGKVFAGGIIVMIGGVASALMVGFLLESNNSYANVVADSYAQQEDVEKEFWDKLSPEDTIKAKELIGKLKASKEGREYRGIENEDEVVIPGVGGGATTTTSATTSASASDENVVNAEKEDNKKKVDAPAAGKKEAVSMFSDYDD